MNSAQKRSSRAGVSLPYLLLGLAVLALLLRLPSIAQPLNIDQSLWASAVRGLEHGQRLYVDVWEQRPPGIYLTYWAAFTIFGWTAGAIALLDVLAAALTTATLFVLVRRLGGLRPAAVTTAIYALMTMPAWLYRYGGSGERSVSETFIVVWVGAAALCAAAFRKSGSLAMAFGIGVAIGAAVVYKPNAAIYFPAILLWSLLPTDGKLTSARSWLRPAIAASIGATVLPALIGVWLWQTGVLAEAKIAIIDFNRYYVVDGFNFTEYPRLFADRVFLRFKTEPLWLVGVAGSLVAVWNVIRRRPLDPWPLLGLLWGAAAVAVIAVNGMRLFNSYFVQALAPLSLVAGWWLTTWWAQGRLTRAIVITAMAVSAVLLVQRNYIPKIVGDIAADTADLTGRGNHQAYLERFGGYENGRGYSARAHEELADYIRAHTAPNDRVFLFGINGAGVYFLAERLTVHRFLRVNFFLEGFPDPRFTLGAVTADLRARRPVYVMFERLHSESAMARQVDALQEDPLVRALLENYALETRIEDFTLYRLRADR